jgi:hypothetical protein
VTDVKARADQIRARHAELVRLHALVAEDYRRAEAVGDRYSMAISVEDGQALVDESTALYVEFLMITRGAS